MPAAAAQAVAPAAAPSATRKAALINGKGEGATGALLRFPCARAPAH